MIGGIFNNNAALARFQEPIVDDLTRFRDYYRKILLSGYTAIDRVVNYLCRMHGKGFRPTLTLLCARLNGGKANEKTIKAAVIVELLHEATLIHDDVVDESPVRRGLPSLPTRFKNKVAVLFGDYMLANVLGETLAARDLRWLDILSETSRRMSRGELLQAARAKHFDMNEDDYLRMIGDKTASLFGACCKMGGLTVGLNDKQVEALGEYGERLGIAFQIKDDLLDIFGHRRGIGKPTGGDLKDKKLTLPLLVALSRADKREGRRIKARIRRGIKRSEVKNVKEFIQSNGGEAYAEKYMRNQVKKAVEALMTLPDSQARGILADIAEFAVERGS